MLGPIFAIEMTTSSRRARQFVVRTLYGIVLLFAFWSVFKAHNIADSYDLGQNANIAASFFYVFAWLQMLAVVLIGPGLAAGTIAVERERRTIEYLFATDLTNREIIFGKLLAQLIQVSFLVLAGLPVLALAMLMGGIAPEQLASTYLTTISSLVLVTTLSLTVSVWSPRVRDAITRIYLLLFVILLLPSIVMPALLYLLGFPGWLQMVFEYLSRLNPFSTLASAAMRGGVDWYFVGSQLTVQGVLTAILLLMALWGVRRVHLNQLGRAPKKSRPSLGRQRKGPGQYPVIWKEFLATRTSKGLGFLGRICIGLIGLAVLGASIYWWFALGAKEAAFATVITTTFLICGFLLLLLSRAATSVTSEREKDTWLTLLSTPLTGREIVLGKLLGSLGHTFGFLVLLCIVWGLQIIRTPVALLGFVFTLATFCIIALFATTLGMNYSLRARSTTRAICYSLATAVFVGGGYLFCCIPMFISGPGGEIVLVPCIPFLVGFPGFAVLEMPSRESGLFTCYAIGNFAYLVASAVIYNTASYKFDEINGRTVANATSKGITIS